MVAETPNPIQGFHAHLYFESETRASAVEIHAQALALPIPGTRVHPLIDRRVGPHTQPMFEIEISTDAFAPMVTWLMLRHGEHSVLIHPITGDEPKDHFVHALWLGRPLPLDGSKLEIPGQPKAPSVRDWAVPGSAFTKNEE